MQRIMGMARKAITEYDMIQNGDRVAVGVSGGKDSVALTMALHWLRRFIGIDYEVVAITLDPCFGGVECDYSPLAELFQVADDPAGVGSGFPFCFLEMVQLFKHNHGKHDLIVLKASKCIRSLEKNICIDNINFYHLVSSQFHIFILPLPGRESM